MVNLGISIQGNLKTTPMIDISEELLILHQEYFELRNKELNSENLDYFLILRPVSYTHLDVYKRQMV